MKLKWLILILLIPVFSKAQSIWIDSLKKNLPQLKGTARIDCLNELGAEFSDRYWSKSQHQQTDTALMYSMLALKESEKLQYLGGVGKAYQNLGVIAEEHGDFKTALWYTQKSLPFLEKENRIAEYHRGRVFLAYCLYQTGSFTESAEISKNEIPYYEAINDTRHIAMVSRMTGRTYDILGNSQTAFSYYQKNFTIQNEGKDIFGYVVSQNYKVLIYMAAGDTANAILCRRNAAAASANQHVSLSAYYQNSAAIFVLQKQYDSAVFTIRQGIGYIQSSNADSLFRKSELMGCYSSLADIFFSVNKFDSTIAYGQQLISFNRNADNIVGLMWALKIVASSYHSKNEYTNALLYTNQLFGLAQSTGAKRYKRDALGLFWNIYEAQHKTNLANSYHLKYALLNDSLERDKYISQAEAWKAINDIKNAEISYQNNLKINAERNNARVAFINREKKVQLYVFIASVALIGLFAFLIVRNVRLQRKKEQLQLMMAETNNLLEKQKREQEVAQLYQQKTELEMQALRAQMNPHFIFNCLSSINRFILKNRTEEASDYLTKFSRLIRMVLNNSKRSFISLEDELETLKLYLEMERLRFKNSFDYSFIYKNSVDVNNIFIPPMLLQPFAENAIWHGLMLKEEKGFVNFDFSMEDKFLTCVITDNGIGRTQAELIKSKSAENQKSMGLKITTERLSLLNNNSDEQTFFTIEDLTDKNGNATGTRVHLKIYFKEMMEV